MKKEHKIFSFDYKKVIGGLLTLGKKMLWFLARDAFVFTLVLVLLAVVFGEFLFYNYVLQVEIAEINTSNRVVTFKEHLYKSVVTRSESRETIFTNPQGMNYQNPFNSHESLPQK